MSDVTLIFTHYGYQNYLEYTLLCVRKTNPNARLILLGDQFNADVTVRHGWEHYLFDNYISRFHDRFSKVFCHVQGSGHNPIKSNRDWLKYVFERWFFIESFLERESIDRFWHFDTDTMILQDLQVHQQNLDWADFTVQCNNTCLNGLIRSVVVSEFCLHICELFENSEFISGQQHEFDTVNPGYAFTEMRAFDHYKQATSRPWAHLLTYQNDEIFDDCICQKHGFKMRSLPSGELVKELFSRRGKIYGMQEDSEVAFVSLNLSWVPDYLFVWVLEALSADLRIQKVRVSIYLRARGFARKIKRLVNNVFF